MSDPREPILLSEEVLVVLRRAAALARRLNEPFISTRALLLSLLDDPVDGPVLAGAVFRDQLESGEPASGAAAHANALPEEPFPEGEAPAMARYDTLAFKMPDSTQSVWLSDEALAMLLDGAQRADGPYLPKHLAFGIAAHAKRSPATLTKLRLDAGAVIDAIYKL